MSELELICSGFCGNADMHTETLGSPGPSDCLERAKEIKGEMMLIFGLQDTHVDEPGRTKIRARLNEVGVQTSFLELVSLPPLVSFCSD